MAMMMAMGIGGMAAISNIAPGTEVTQTLSLVAWFDAKPGDYTVRISCGLPNLASGVGPRDMFFPEWEDKTTQSCRLHIPAKL